MKTVHNDSPAEQSAETETIEGEWLVRRDRLRFDLKMLRQSLDNLQAGLDADRARFSDRTPAEWVDLAIRNVELRVADMRPNLADPVDAELAAEALAEYRSRQAFVEAVAAIREGGVR